MSSLITLSEAQTYLGIPAADTLPLMNIEITNYISAVSEWIETQVGRTIALSTYTASPNFSFYNGIDIKMGSFNLKAYPVGTVSALYDSPTLTFATSETFIYLDDYVVDFAAGVIHMINGVGFVSAMRNVRVDYTAGYATTPEDLKLATKIMVKELYNDGQSGINAVPNERPSVMFNWDESNHFVKTIIKKYRTPTV